MEFDEMSCINMMRQALQQAGRPGAAAYDDDELLNILDMIWDYYESRGMLDPDAYDDDEPEGEELVSELVQYTAKMLKRDREANVDPADIDLLVRAELAYEESLEKEL